MLMIPISEENTLFIIDYEPDEQMLTFRSSRNKGHKRIEKVMIKEGTVYVGVYTFLLIYLKTFIKN